MLLYKFLGVSFLFKRSTKTKTFSSSSSGSPKRLCFDLSFQRSERLYLLACYFTFTSLSKSKFH